MENSDCVNKDGCSECQERGGSEKVGCYEPYYFYEHPDPNFLIRLRAGPIQAEHEDEYSMVQLAFIIEAWPHVHTGNPVEHYHLYRILFYLGEKAEEHDAGPLVDEINCLLDLFDVLVGDGLLKMKKIWQEQFNVSTTS